MENIDNIVIAQKRLIEVRGIHETFFRNRLHVIGDQDVFQYFTVLTFEPFAVLTIKKDTEMKLLPEIIEDLKKYFEVRE